MNLHGIAAPYVGAVNPLVPVTVRLSSGPAEATADGGTAPTYSTPAAFTASIAAATATMTVTAVSQGRLGVGDTVAGAGVPGEAEVAEQLSGDAGGAGDYLLTRAPAGDVAEEAMTSSLTMLAQVQPITWRDLQQIDGLSLNGTRRKIYLYGAVDSVNRVSRGGGDLVTIAAGGADDGVWLVAQVIEQWPDWVACAATLQNEG